ncbi:MAG: Ribosomal small subunit methyltransferase [Pseudomonadota bacterium]
MGQVRIISGQWRRRRIDVADRPGLRPTPDRVRETLFNWLDHLQDDGWSDLRVLDAFAGTGALGFEAASRGARQVTLIDRDREAFLAMQAVSRALNASPQQVSVLQADGIAFLERCPESSLDLIFLDPPFRQGLLEQALLLSARAIRPGGLIYVESEQSIDEWLSQAERPTEFQTLSPVRSLRAGQVMVGLLSSQKIASPS